MTALGTVQGGLEIMFLQLLLCVESNKIVWQILTSVDLDTDSLGDAL